MTTEQLRELFENRLVIGGTMRAARLKSQYAENMSAAARAAGITPSYLHRIEDAHVLASADTCLAVMRAYGADPDPILWLLDSVDSELRVALLAFMAKRGRKTLLKMLTRKSAIRPITIDVQKGT